jgi:heat shock protein HslJ
MHFLRSSLRLPFLVLSAMAVMAFGVASTIGAQPADPGSLPGTQWQLVSYGTPGAETPVIAASVITLEFPAANQVAGNAGCNQYSGGYGVEQADIVFSDIVSTLMACETAISDQEAAYLQALESATAYAQTDEQLELWYDNEQQHLVFMSIVENPLLDTGWQLVSYGEPDNQTPVIEGSSISLTFASNIQIEGNGGCNGYGGNYTVDGDSISFSEVVSTLMACAEDDITQQESNYFSALNTATSYEIAGNQLIVTTSDGQELHFVSTNPLLNTEWQLVSYGDPVSEVPVVEGSTLTLAFRPEGMVEGNGGCNGFGGSYTLDGSNLTISEIISTMMACAEDDATQQESTYFQALQAATRFVITGSELTIFYGEGADQLNFVAVNQEAADLTGSQWQLTFYGDPANPTAANIERLATLSFDTEAQVSGNTGCNGFGGSYQASGSDITFSDIIQTEMACEGVMEQETAYVQALLAATSYEVTSDQLVITYPDGELTFVTIPTESSAVATEESAATAEATSEQ